MSCLDAFVRDILTAPFTYLKDSFFSILFYFPTREVPGTLLCTFSLKTVLFSGGASWVLVKFALGSTPTGSILQVGHNLEINLKFFK